MQADAQQRGLARLDPNSLFVAAVLDGSELVVLNSFDHRRVVGNIPFGLDAKHLILITSSLSRRRPAQFAVLEFMREVPLKLPTKAFDRIGTRDRQELVNGLTCFGVSQLGPTTTPSSPDVVS